MPELPDVTVYIECLERCAVPGPIEDVRLASPFLLRSVDPPLQAIVGVPLTGFRRIGKRIVFEFEDELFLVIHLMIAGRLRWRERGAKLPGRRGLAAFDFPDGSLLFTEAGTKKRASMHVVRGEEALAEHDPGGLEIEGATLAEFTEVLRSENHTLKRSLTDPRLYSGIGNAYSDEILHRARLSPLALSKSLSDEDTARLFDATRETLALWTQRLRDEVGDGFPDKVTAFRAGMATHGRYGEPCPDCAAPIQRIAYADRETNYCAKCQTGGKLLSDRALARLLKDDCPKRLEDLEELKRGRGTT